MSDTGDIGDDEIELNVPDEDDPNPKSTPPSDPGEEENYKSSQNSFNRQGPGMAGTNSGIMDSSACFMELQVLRTSVAELYERLPAAQLILDMCDAPDLIHTINDVSQRGGYTKVIDVLLHDLTWTLERTVAFVKGHPVTDKECVARMYDDVVTMRDLLAAKLVTADVNVLETEMRFQEACARAGSIAHEASLALVDAAMPKLRRLCRLHRMMSPKNGALLALAGVCGLCAVGVGCQGPTSVAASAGYPLAFAATTGLGVGIFFSPSFSHKWIAVPSVAFLSLSPILVHLFDTPSHYSASVVPALLGLTALYRRHLPWLVLVAPPLWTTATIVAVALQWNVLTFLTIVIVVGGCVVMAVYDTINVESIGRSHAVHCRSVKTRILGSELVRRSKFCEGDRSSSKPNTLAGSLNNSSRRLSNSGRGPSGIIWPGAPPAPQETEKDNDRKGSDENSDASSHESVINQKDVAEAKGESPPLMESADVEVESSQMATILGMDDGAQYTFSMDTVHAFLAVVAVNNAGNVIVWNQAMTRNTGFKAQDAHSIHLSTFLTASEKNAISGLVDTPISLQTLCFLKKGQTCGVPMRLSSSKMFSSANVSVGMVFVGVPIEDNSARQNVGQWFSTLLHSQIIAIKDSVTNNNPKGSSRDATLAAVGNCETLLGRMRHVMCDEGQTTVSEIDLVQFTSKLISEYELRPYHVVLDKTLPESVQMDSGALLSLEQFVASVARRANAHNTVARVELKQVQEQGGTFMQVVIVDQSPALSRKKLAALFDGGKDSDMLHAAQRIQKAGGSFAMKSKKGVGTTILVNLPFLAHDQTGAHLVESHLSDVEAIPFATLMLETVEVYRNSLCQTLWKRRHAIQQAYTLKQAMTILEQVSIEIVIVSIATKNARRHAMELISAARARSTHIQFVMTGDSIDLSRPPSINGKEGTMLQKCAAAGILLIQTPFKSAQVNDIMGKLEEVVLTVRNEAEVKKGISRVLGEKKNPPWVKGKQLGSGAAGTVYEATFELTGGRMAVKVVQLRGMSDADIVPFLQEIELLSRLEHENIITYFYSDKTDTELRVFMEFASEGCLQKLTKEGPLEGPLAAAFMKDILKGMEYLHANDVIHRDLKCANILLSSGYIAKVADFGCATNLDKVGDGIAGTPSFMAPELLDGSRASKSADVWALGCLLWEMLSGELPFPEYRGMVPLIGFLGEAGRTDEHVWAKVPDFGFPSGNAFIKACLHVDPTKRPTCTELLQFEFISLSKKEIQFDVSGSEYSECPPEEGSVVTYAMPTALPSALLTKPLNVGPKLVRRKSHGTKNGAILSAVSLQNLEKSNERQKTVKTFFDDSDSSSDTSKGSVASDASVNTFSHQM